VRALRVLSGPGEGRFLVIDADVIVGREDADFVLADLVLDDAELSLRHVLVRPVERGLVIEDLRSKTGTFVDGGRITEPVLVTRNATMRAGLTEIAVEITPEPVNRLLPVSPQNAVPAAASGGRRRRPLVPVLLLLTLAGAGIALVLVFSGNDSRKSRRLVGTAETAVLKQDGPQVIVVGIVRANPIGQMAVVIRRTVQARPLPGGPPVGLLLHITFSQARGGFIADVAGTVTITKTGGEIVRGRATVSNGTGTYKDAQGTFTIAGDNGRATTISRFRLAGVLEY
jgi:pSer/pThr/pTyr-binding forkhead associated (FHA) protein